MGLYFWCYELELVILKLVTFELRGSMGIPSTKNSRALGVVLGIPSEPRSSKLRLIVLLSNRMTSGIHARYITT